MTALSSSHAKQLKEQNRLRISYGAIGVAVYWLLSVPLLREALFGKQGKILDEFSGEISISGQLAASLAQATLLIPHFLQAEVFSKFEIKDTNLLVMALMSPIVYRYFEAARTKQDFLSLLILFSPAPLLFLSNFNKEIILVFFLNLAYGLDSSLRARTRGVFMFIYAALMRIYLIWIPFVFHAKALHLAVFGALLFIATSIVPELQYAFLDVLNRRMMDKSVEANSEILQTIFVGSFWDLPFMLGEVLPQIYAPFFLSPSLKTLYFNFYLGTLIYFLIRKRGRVSLLLALLLILYTILDPDLGAFFRHIASFFAIFPLLLKLNSPPDNIRRRGISIFGRRIVWNK